jgi:hypothetical protein
VSFEDRNSGVERFSMKNAWLGRFWMAVLLVVAWFSLKYMPDIVGLPVTMGIVAGCVVGVIALYRKQNQPGW